MISNRTIGIMVIVVVIILLVVMIILMTNSKKNNNLVNGSPFPSGGMIEITNTSDKTFVVAIILDTSGNLMSLLDQNQSQIAFTPNEKIIFPATPSSQSFTFLGLDANGSNYMTMMGNVNNAIHYFHYNTSDSTFSFTTTTALTSPGLTMVHNYLENLGTGSNPVHPPTGIPINNGAAFPTNLYLYNTNNVAGMDIMVMSSVSGLLDLSAMSNPSNTNGSHDIMLGPSTSSLLGSIGTIPTNGYAIFLAQLFNNESTVYAGSLLFNNGGQVFQVNIGQSASLIEFRKPNGTTVENPTIYKGKPLGQKRKLLQ